MNPGMKTDKTANLQSENDKYLNTVLLFPNLLVFGMEYGIIIKQTSFLLRTYWQNRQDWKRYKEVNAIKDGKFPNPNTIHPSAGYEKEIYVKPTITNPDIIVGDFTYLADSEF